MNKLEEWYEISRLLKEAKAKEAELRRELCEEFIGNEPMENGRVTVKGAIGHLNFTAVQALGYNVDQVVLDSIWPALTEVDKEAIKYKPSLALTNYKRLPEDSLLHEAITARLSMPTLKVEEALV